MAQHPRNGFTLIELLIFSAIFSLIIGAFITILVVLVSVQASQSASGEAQQQGQFLVQQFQYYIESARLVDAPQDVPTSTLVLRESLASSSYDPTIFTVNNGTVYLQQGAAAAPQAFTSGKVAISNLSFTRHYNVNSSSSAFGTDSVSYSFMVTSNAGNQQYSQLFQSSATVLASVGRIAFIQQAKAEDNTGSSVSSLAEAFPTANDAGDLLLAVVTYRGAATSSITDSNGNAWTQVASWQTATSYLQNTTLYEAPNSVGGANTPTVTFSTGSGGATYASVMFYEYRGASTVFPFDAWDVQSQTGVSTPTSPFVSPMPTAELLLGIDVNAAGSPGATFSPGAGYTLESSSTPGNATQVFVEDMNQYVTNPVAASWQSSILTNSSAMIATFAAGNGGGTPSYNVGLVGYWPMDEGSGSTATDASGNGNIGTWSGATPYYTAGKVGNYAGNFDGTSDNLAIGNAPGLQIASGTMSAWIKTTNAGSSFRGIIVKQAAYGMFLNSNEFGLYDWSVYTWRGTGITLADGSWHFVACTFQSGVTNGTFCYIDGVLQLTTTMTVGSQGNQVFVGYGNAPSQNFTGSIDDARVYGRVLSSAEIQALYNSQK